jgi:hypothetical protein
VEAALKAGKMPLQADLMPHVLGRLSSGRMRIVLHATAVADGWPTISGLTDEARYNALHAAGAADVQILDPPQGGSEVADQLIKWGWSFVDSLLPRDLQGPAFVDRDIIIEGRTVLPCPLTTTGTVVGFDPARDHDFVTEVDLGNPIFPILDITTRTNALFAEDNIDAVLVDISYAGDTHTFTFTDADQEMHARFHWKPAQRDTYSYSTSVQFVAAAQRLILPPKQSNAHQLTVNLDDIGRLTVDVSALAVDWSDLAEIVVTVESGGVQIPLTSEPIQLTPDIRGARYERRAPGSFDGGWRYSVDYVFNDGRRIHHDPAPGFGHQIIIDDPYPQRLRVDINTYGGFDGITSHTVEVHYEGRMRTVVLDAAHPSASVSFGTDSLDDTKYQWRCVTSYADGHHVTTPDAVTDDRVLLVGPPRSESLDVRIAADLLDPAVVKLVKVSVTHRRADGSEDTQARALAPGAPDAVIAIPLADGDQPTYTVRTTVFRVDGSRAESGPTDSSDPAIVLPPHGV